MSPTNDGSSARAQEIHVVLDQCVDRLAEGESITKEQVIAAHRDLMPELGDELRKLSLIERAQRRAHDAGSSSGIAATVEAKGTVWIKDADTIPGYRIVRELHRGGQGIVYEAFQESTRRKVAVKVMKEGPFAGPADEARFSREVQVLGQLRHPNIVAIHDSGSSAGHHYFAMDYVPGQPLDAYMASARPSLDETLRLFAKICEAVNAAHLRGVIHRDLKPGNIRIDTDGEPRILDFGLAKVAIPDAWPSGPPLSTQPGAAGPQPMTMTGQFLGSLPWASPEQAEAVPSKIDLRTDVYSLGVILYHMLTGKFPYDVLGNMRDVIDNILTAEPVRPSTIRRNGERLARQINDEVETIVLKCLQKERDRRYQTAGELARDVNRYLNGEPIEAKRDSLAYVLRKQLKRYRIPAVIAASFVVLITAGLIVSLTLWQRSERALTAEQEQRDEAQRQAEIARVVNEFLNEDLLAQASPDQEPDRDIKLREVLDRTSERLEGRFEGQPLVEAAIRTTLGETYYSLGEYGAARPHLEQALEIREHELGVEHSETLTSMNKLGLLYASQARHKQAEWLYTDALAISKSALGAEHPDTLETMNGLANLYCDQGRYREAEALYVEVVQIARQVLGDEHLETSVYMNNLAGVYCDLGRFADAEPLFAGVLDLRRRSLGHDHPYTANAINSLAYVYYCTGRFDDAEPLYVKALELRRRVLGNVHPETLATMNNLAALHMEQGRLTEAQLLYAEVLDTEIQVLGENHPRALSVMDSLAVVHYRQGHHAEAEALCARALDLRRRVLGENHPDTLYSKSNLAAMYVKRGRYEEAKILLVDSLEIRRRELGEDHPDTLTCINNLAALYLDQEQYDEAESLLIKSLEIRRRVLGLEHTDTLTSMNNLAAVYARTGRYQLAEPLYMETLEIARRVLGEEHPSALAFASGLARVYKQQGRYEEAELLYVKILETRGRTLGDEHPQTLDSLGSLANLYSEQQRFGEAESLLLDSCAGLENDPDAPPERVHEALRRIVDLYEAWDKPEQTAEWRAKLPPADSDAAGDDATHEPDSP